MVEFLTSNIITIPLVILIAFALFRFRKRRLTNMNFQYQKPDQTQTVNMEVDQPIEGEILGDTDYDGNTGGVDWKLKSTVQKGSTGGVGNKVWRRKSMWRTEALKLPASKFILIMSIPGELKLGNIERGGFINDIIIKTADTVLDLYVGGYFGNEYKSLVNIGDDGVKIVRDQLKDFMILTNMEPLAQKYFDEATAATISHWKKNNAGFKDEKKVDQFGLLFSPDGVILTCQTSMSNANEVKAFSDFGAALTIKMQQVNA